jgi:hypothetical protein
MIAQRNEYNLALEAIPGRYRLLFRGAYEHCRKSGMILAVVWAFMAGCTLTARISRADCAPPDTAPQICLSGTVTSPEYQSALVELSGSSDLERLRPGDTVLDWKVAEIGARYIVLDRDGRQVRLELATAASPQAPPGKGTPKQGPMLRARVLEERGDRQSAE